jgi:hypothetical protein
MELIELAGSFKKLLDAVPDIERLGSLQAVENEIKARIARLQSEEATISNSYRVRAQTEVAEGKAAAILAKAELDAEAIKANAERQARNLAAKVKDLETRAAQLQVANDATEARLKRAHDAFRAAG